MEILQGFVDAVVGIFSSSGLTTLNWQNYVMIGISIVLLYLAIKKQYEPLLLLPIAFGMLLYPPLIFLGIGCMTDFGPLISNPKSLILGAAAQIGIFVTFTGAIFLGFTAAEENVTYATQAYYNEHFRLILKDNALTKLTDI